MRPTDRDDGARVDPDLQELFDRSAAPLSAAATRRMEAAARRIPGEAAAARRPLLPWLTGAVLAGTAALLLLVLWSAPPRSGNGAPDALASRIPDAVEARDRAADAGGAPAAALQEWEASLDPFGSDEAPDLVGSLAQVPGPGDPSLELWVQAADELLSEHDGI
ncbi:MAG: hypothetical protein FJ098_01545 [Deltaproteobacteria bacterium]|nr:hypothetical protein [Deltaproteobacteria bacterium]